MKNVAFPMSLKVRPMRFARSSWLEARARLFLFRRQRQSEDRNHSLPGDIGLGLSRSRQIECFAVLAPIDFGVRPPGLLDVPTLTLDGIGFVEPEFQMPAAELPLRVFLVAGALPSLLDLDLMVGELRNILGARSGHFASRQSAYPHSSGQQRRWIRPDAAIVTEFRAVSDEVREQDVPEFTPSLDDECNQDFGTVRAL